MLRALSPQDPKMKLSPTLCLAASLFATAAQAQHTAWVVRVGGQPVDPESDNDTLAGMRARSARTPARP